MISWRSCLFADQPIHGVDFKENWPETKVFAFQTWMFPVPYIKQQRSSLFWETIFPKQCVHTSGSYSKGWAWVWSRVPHTSSQSFGSQRKSGTKRCVSCPLLELYVHVLWQAWNFRGTFCTLLTLGGVGRKERWFLRLVCVAGAAFACWTWTTVWKGRKSRFLFGT